MARHALVTGSTRGIGREIALALARHGVRTCIHGRDAAAAAATAAALPAVDSGPHAHVGAVLGPQGSGTSLFTTATAALGGSIDILVNNAATFLPHPPLSTDATGWASAWTSTLALNLHAPAELAAAAARHWGPAPAASHGTARARIIAVSSRGAFRGEPSAPAYGASKAGLNALHQSLARALGPHGILVAVVAPGWVRTDMSAGRVSAATLAEHPIGRIAEPAEVAEAVRWLALEAPLALTGSILDLNGASYLRS